MRFIFTLILLTSLGLLFCSSAIGITWLFLAFVAAIFVEVLGLTLTLTLLASVWLLLFIPSLFVICLCLGIWAWIFAPGMFR